MGNKHVKQIQVDFELNIFKDVPNDSAKLADKTDKVFFCVYLNFVPQQCTYYNHVLCSKTCPLFFPLLITNRWITHDVG